jgi:SprT-like family protein
MNSCPVGKTGPGKEGVMQRKLNESINIHIMENEKDALDWELNDLARELYWWVDFFNTAFFKSQPVPVPAISFEKTKVSNLGHYVVGRNALGIKENININRAHLYRPLWDILATLVHEMSHSWQYIYGKPSKSWFHNKEFQMKMLELGIVCNNKGCHLGIGDPFVFLLKKHGIRFNLNFDLDGVMKIPPKPKKKGNSKLKKWTCGCTNIRVAIADLEAECLKCGNRFELII